MRLRTLILGAILLLATTIAPANQFSGISTTGNPSACYTDDVKQLIQDCIMRNMTNPPPGNPGPFTRGYKSMVVLAAQCYSGGFQSLTTIGDNIVVGAAASPEKESSNLGPLDNRQMEWLRKVMDQIIANPNRPIKDILDAAKAASADTADAMTPDPAVSNGGNTVTMGDPMNNMQPAMSFHAVLFAGIAETDTGSNEDKSTRLRHAHKKALDDMEEVLKTNLHVPAANIKKKFGGSYADLQMLIRDTWLKMNDNEQFIFVIADHGNRCCLALIIQELLDRVRAIIATANYMTSSNVLRPTLEIDTQFLNQAGPVTFNGFTVGTVSPFPTPRHWEFVLTPSMLAPVDADNTIDVVVPPSQMHVDSIALQTGPVAKDPIPPGDSQAPGTAVNLRLTKGPGNVGLTWNPGCPVGNDYALYEGQIGAWSSHMQRTCSTGGVPAITIPPQSGNRYYLVVPRSPIFEGSYGTRSSGSEIPPGLGACVPQHFGLCP